MSDLGTIAAATGLESAINILWAASAALVAQVPADRLITGRVPPSEQMPYVRLEADGGSETSRTNQSIYATEKVVFHIWSRRLRRRPGDRALDPRRLRRHGLRLDHGRRARHEMGRPARVPPDQRSRNQGLANNRVLHVQHLARAPGYASNHQQQRRLRYARQQPKAWASRTATATSAARKCWKSRNGSSRPRKKCGAVVTNVTGGFEGQIMGAVGGYGSVTLVIPKTGYQTPPQFGATPILNLYADAAKLHGYTQMPIAVEKNSVSDRPQFERGHHAHLQLQGQRPLQRHRHLRRPRRL